MFKDKVPLNIVIPIIVITWVLSLISALAIVTVMPGLLPISRIGPGSVTSDYLADGAVITVKLADGNVTSAKILDGTITAVDMADNSIITAKIVDGSVTTTKIGDASVTTDKIADNAIVTIKLADNSITSAKIVDGSVTGLDLATGTIITANIANGAVTTEKLANFSVTALKLAAYAIPFNSTYSIGVDTTTSTTFVDMPDMSVDITITRNSTLLIMFSTQAEVAASGNYLYMRAMVNATPANPASSYIFITGITNWNAHSFNFYQSVTPGAYTVKMQWRVFLSSSTGDIDERTLIVMALPT